MLDLLQASDDNTLTLYNILNPLTTTDSLPSTVTVRLNQDTPTLIEELEEAAEDGWWSIFSGQWAYEVTNREGTRRLGSYSRGDWSYDAKAEIRLPAIGPPVREVDTLLIYSVDNASADRIDSLLPRLAIWNDSVGDLRAIYLYPTVERIGLRRGSMEAVQVDDNSLHVVPDALPGTIYATENTPDFYAGMTFAHEGYRVFNGYGGREVAPSLDSLLSLRVNALAIVPYTFMQTANRVGELPVPTGAGSENDAAVTYAIRQAHARGLAVLLKPQIWVGGAWPGDVQFATETEWDQFFTTYEQWMLHYARMAQAEGIAALCIGTELVHATLDHPDRWRTMIKHLRRVYDGKLTYAANWGEEFEQLSFWKELDAVGLNSYYPLATGTNPTDDELHQGAQSWMQLADSISLAVERPLWLTEVGYRSVERAWTNPHADAGDRPASAIDQARCYAALLAAADASSRLQGIFVWKWPSYLGYSDRTEPEDRGFTPGGKPAAALLESFYRTRPQTTRE
ncbi:glycoside hydrolase family 113 [Neolewinella maritima]|uniref:glycoside hydrolase family 113 n=1 Tax=Neolewinella maritima TaxID=1383882 RepID=UPI001EE85EA7|nr:hypothetical protein [Neolewinella maritima]